MDSKRQSVAPTPPSSKRQRIDSDPPPNSQVEDSLSSLSPTSHLSSPELESNLPSKSNSNNGEEVEEVDVEIEEEEEEEEEEEVEEEEEEVDDTGNNNSSEVGGDEAPPVGEEEEEEEEEEAENEELTRHHELSAKTLPSHQPGPADIVLNGNGNGSNNNRATVGGKGKRGEEALEHAVAAREQVERRREENRQERMQQGSKSGLPPPGGAASLLAAKATLMGLVANGAQNVKVKVEEEEPVVVAEVEDDDDDDLGPPLKRERPALQEERDNIIRFVVVTNDGTPASLIILTGLKNIFQKQLPKMPREYIARLVYDRNHYSMAIVKRGLEVVGGITYRPFEARKFAEIVFCAITGTEQVKGYGSHLMNHLKDYVKMSTACMHFLTYADNYAIGYFKKQGFTKEVGLDRSVWAGYIKDYEGGTIMHCSMLEVIKYLDAASILAKQKEVILGEIRLLSRSHIIHPGLSLFASLPPDGALDPSQVPGLKESGWTPEMDDLTRRPKRGPQFAIMQRLLTLLNDHPSAWAFANPVNAGEVTDYYEVIKEPMDLATMDRKLETNTYTNLVEFTDDAKRIFNNCRAYNDPGSNYVKNANKLELYLAEQVKLFDQ